MLRTIFAKKNQIIYLIDNFLLFFNDRKIGKRFLYWNYSRINCLIMQL